MWEHEKVHKSSDVVSTLSLVVKNGLSKMGGEEDVHLY